jgi:hypothetical protein
MRLRRATTIAIGGLLASVSAAALFQSLASSEATRRVETALSRIPGAHAAAVSVDPWTGRVSLSGLTAEVNGVKVSARHAVLRAGKAALPALISSAFAADDSVSADDIDVDIGIGKIHIPHIEASGTSLTDDDLKEIIDPNSALSATDRMDKLTADTIEVPEIDLSITAGEVSEKVVYHDVKLASVESGKIGALSIGTGDLSVTGPKMPGPMEGKLGALTAKNVDLGLYARILTEARSDTDEALKTLVESMSFDGLELKVGDTFKMTVGKVLSRDTKARPFLIALRDIKDMIPSEPGAKLPPEQTKKLFSFLSDIYTSFSVGLTEVNDISFHVSDPRNTVDLGFTRLSLSDMADAHLGELALEGMNVSAADGHVKMGRFSIKGFNFKSMVEAMQKITPEDNNPFQGLNPRTLIPTIDQILFAGIDADVPDPRHQGNAADGARDVFRIGRIEFDASNYLLGLPTSITAIVDHVIADLPTNDPNLKQFAALGYPKVDISTKFDMAWNEAANELALKEFSLKGADMGSFVLKGVIGNVTKDVFVGAPAVMQAAALAAVIKGVQLRIDDFGLFDKALAFAAQQAGKSPEELRRDYIAAAAVGIPQVMGDVPAAKTVANAIAKFIAQPKSLEIDAESPDGLGAADLPLLGNPPELFRRLKITATANE